MIFCNVFKYCWVGFIVLFKSFTTVFHWGKTGFCLLHFHLFWVKSFLKRHLIWASDHRFSLSPRECRKSFFPHFCHSELYLSVKLSLSPKDANNIEIYTYIYMQAWTSSYSSISFFKILWEGVEEKRSCSFCFLLPPRAAQKPWQPIAPLTSHDNAWYFFIMLWLNKFNNTMNAMVVEICVGVVYIIVGSLHHYAMKTVMLFFFVCFLLVTTLEHTV